MRTTISAALICGVVGVALCLRPGLSSAPAAEAEVWLSDYPAAKRLAREHGKPLFVVFRCER